MRAPRGARAELRAAANWYDEPETGQELLDATPEERRDIAAMPEAWPPVGGWEHEPRLRRKTVAGFPYGVIYFLTSEEVVIVAYASREAAPRVLEESPRRLTTAALGGMTGGRSLSVHRCCGLSG